MDIDAFAHLWAGATSIIGISAAAMALSFAVRMKKRFGGVLGNAINEITLSLACILLIIVFYFTSGIYLVINGLRYPSWLSEIFISTLLSTSLVLAFAAAKTLKEGTEFK